MLKPWALVELPALALRCLRNSSNQHHPAVGAFPQGQEPFFIPQARKGGRARSGTARHCCTS
uniref:Uncharacterized protein n=1 Tax=Arundo donax TaxID=35708 RepID=A0A0A9BPG2_ARUDO